VTPVLTKSNQMTHEERINLIQGLNDRLLYLSEEKRKEFLGYLDALYSVYQFDRVVRYGKDIIKTESNGERVPV
jgi:hypothetical protein